jgi:DnaJ-class molecular chaperone
MDDPCSACDGWGWRTDPENRYGPEVECGHCHGSGHEPAEN